MAGCNGENVHSAATENDNSACIQSIGCPALSSFC
jgi:hypothetical protein